MRTMDHVRHLAETIGPRGSTTTQEQEAARYAELSLRSVGLEPTTEHFNSARSGWYPYALFSGLLLVSEIIFLFGGQWGAITAAVVTLFSLVAVLLELAFRPNPLRWLLPKGRSQNVWVRIAPKTSTTERVVLLGHLDTHRTPLVFSTDKLVKLFKILIPFGLASSVFLLLIFTVHIFMATWFWQLLTLPFVIAIAGIFILTLQADRTPYTAGANDNASGAGIALSIAERLNKEPLINTAVWVVLSGCEEVGCYGAEAFVRTHAPELGDTAWITLDSLGGAGGRPCYLTREKFLLTAKSDPQLITLAREVAAQHKTLNAHAYHGFSGAYTEGSIGGKYRLRVLSVTALTPDGKLKEWHRTTDVVENLDPDLVARCELFLWELLKAIDRHAEIDKGGKV
ncbi:MAG: M28 family peptidase [Desulfobacterales bacterium]|jgi:hypothetical protein